MGDVTESQTLRSKLLKNIAVTGAIGVVALLIILPYTFYLRDRAEIHGEANKMADLIRTGLLSTMMATGEPEDVRRAVDNFKKIVAFDFRMVRSKYVRNQFGDREGEVPRDKIEKDILEGKEKLFANLSGTTFRYVSPFISDIRCQRCHLDLLDDPIPVGTVMGLSEIVFDVSEKRAESLKMIFQVLLEILVLLSLGIAGLYMMFAKNVLAPIKMITDNIGRLQKDEFDISLPPHGSREIDILIGQVQRTAKALKAKKDARDEELKAEREKVEKIRSFAAKQADSLGITDENEISEIMDRLSGAVKEVEKSQMLARVTEFVTGERKEMVLGNEVDLVRPASLYLTDLISGKESAVKKGAVELAMEEAITNAIIHGNLEVPSTLKEDDYEKFDALVSQRIKEAPYNTRKVKIFSDFGCGSGDRTDSICFKIIDEGPGFDWKSRLEKEVGTDFLPHGRGIIIMRTFASEIKYNEQGNEVSLKFNL